MHFPHASVFLISFGFQHYLPGMVWCMTLPPGYGMVYGGGGALNEGLEWRAMNGGGHEPVGPEFDPR